MRHLFARDVTRAIPPVVYFHEQDPHKLMAEVDEYIITGGYPIGHASQKRVPIGIHEQYVALLQGILGELDTPGGPSLPTAWLSGFYGSGKSSFAKLIGLALDRYPGVTLPDGRPLHAALIARDQSPDASTLARSFEALVARVRPLSVVFDVGGTARDQEHIHMVAVRQLQRRLGYSLTDPHVADFELRLERDGEYDRFLTKAQEVLGVPWSTVKDKALAEEDFSLVLHHLFPQRYPDPMAWYASRGSTRGSASTSPQEATLAIRDMLALRAPDATLFLVVDEVSQYVIGHSDRIDRLRAFATELGAVLKGKVWLIALGQQKLDEQADQNNLGWMKDRFPQKLRLHLAPTNIRDVIHRRLLAKTEAAQDELRALFTRHRSLIAMYAYAAADLTPDDFVEVYPLLPNHIDLLLQITSAMRQRTSRAQGDDHGIRGVLQLLGELFRSQGLADAPVGTLVTFDRIYEIIHTALDSDLQASMARVLAQTVNADPLHLRCAKVVALLEHIQENLPTTAELVAQCLYDRVDCGDRLAEVKAALEALHHQNLLGHGDKTGYKIQSTSAEEWEQEKQRLGHTREQLAALVKDALTRLPAFVRPKLGKREFPFKITFATRLIDEGQLVGETRDQAAVAVDFRWLQKDEASEAQWIARSAETALRTRIVWVAGDDTRTARTARELARSRDMVARYRPRRDSLSVAKKNLLNYEESRSEDLQTALVTELGSQLMEGKVYFGGLPIDPREHGQAVGTALTAVATRYLAEIYKHFESVDVQPSHIKQLIDDNLSGLGVQFMSGPLQLFDLEAGKYIATATGTVPTRILDEIRRRSGMSGSDLFQVFAAPPFAWTNYMVMAAIAGLVRARRLEIQPEDGDKVTRLHEPGVRDLFEKDRAFRAANFYLADEPIGPRPRNRIAQVLEDGLGLVLERDEDRIVDTIGKHMPQVARQAREVLARHARLSLEHVDPVLHDLERFATSAEHLASVARYTERTMKAAEKDLDVLRDGFQALKSIGVELTDAHATAILEARRVARNQGAQLGHVPGYLASEPEVAAALESLRATLSTRRPWLEVDALRAATQRVSDAYRAERARILAWQEAELERVKGEVRALVPFARLGDDGKHQVMRLF
ncbi:MAG: BREX system P-loop protein BrxC, partial [Deltaproteobacteria bacterium]|nr:BREX system P-loop protein BrxC [Deltaproteobacteria bacterium]